jgi:hypothetical protein
MGTKSVGISQYERNMKASKMVSMTTDDVNGRKTFEFVNPSDCTFDSSDESNELKGSSGLRQRKNVGSERVETLGPEGDQLISNDSNSKNCKIDNDPIKWFGVTRTNIFFSILNFSIILHRHIFRNKFLSCGYTTFVS